MDTPLIDQSRIHLLLRKSTLRCAAQVSVVLFFLVPVLALLCLAVGYLTWSVCWLIWGLLVLVGVIGAIAALALVPGVLGSEEEMIGVGTVGLVTAGASFGAAAAIRPTLIGFGDQALTNMTNWSEVIFHDVFLGNRLYLWSWSGLVILCASAGIVLLMIGLLRTGSPLKRVFRRIAYTCPACHHRGDPAFRCPNQQCGQLIHDLRPSRFGVFRTHCAACSTLLPTTNWSGRLNLKKVCSSCGRDLVDESLGRRPEIQFAYAGAVHSGKTCLMLATVVELERWAAIDPSLDVRVSQDEVGQYYRETVERMDRGEVPDKTLAPGMPRALNVTVKPQWKQGTLFYLYDARGEDFEQESSLELHRFHGFADGLIFVVDPFVERGLRDLVRRDPADDRHDEFDQPDRIVDVLGRMVNRLEQLRNAGPKEKFPIPVLVVITKADAIDLSRADGDLAINDPAGCATAGDAANAVELGSNRVKRLLEENGLHNIVSIIESRFDKVRYTTVSALGRSPDEDNTASFRPKNILHPFLWLCREVNAVPASARMTSGTGTGTGSDGKPPRPVVARQVAAATLVSAATATAIACGVACWPELPSDHVAFIRPDTDRVVAGSSTPHRMNEVLEPDVESTRGNPSRLIRAAEQPAGIPQPATGPVDGGPVSEQPVGLGEEGSPALAADADQYPGLCDRTIILTGGDRQLATESPWLAGRWRMPGDRPYDMQLAQAGPILMGSYDRGHGALFGRIEEDRRVRGVWFQDAGHGFCTFVIQPDEHRLLGTWQVAGESTSGEWDFRRQSVADSAVV